MGDLTKLKVFSKKDVASLLSTSEAQKNWNKKNEGTSQNSARYVMALQAGLKMLGRNLGEIDALYGGQTRAAVIAFQKENGLQVDGAPGTETIGKMLELLGGKTTKNKKEMNKDKKEIPKKNKKELKPPPKPEPILMRRDETKAEDILPIPDNKQKREAEEINKEPIKEVAENPEEGSEELIYKLDREKTVEQIVKEEIFYEIILSPDIIKAGKEKGLKIKKITIKPTLLREFGFEVDGFYYIYEAENFNAEMVVEGVKMIPIGLSRVTGCGESIEFIFPNEIMSDYLSKNRNKNNNHHGYLKQRMLVIYNELLHAAVCEIFKQPSLGERKGFCQEEELISDAVSVRVDNLDAFRVLAYWDVMRRGHSMITNYEKTAIFTGETVAEVYVKNHKKSKVKMYGEYQSLFEQGVRPWETMLTVNDLQDIAEIYKEEAKSVMGKWEKYKEYSFISRNFKL